MKIPKKEDLLRVKNTRNRIAEALNEAMGEEITWKGPIPPQVMRELKDAGWQVQNTHKSSPLDGPGTQPTWKIS